MNILFVVSHLRKGGPIDVVYNLCCELLKYNDINIYIATLRNEGKESKMQYFKQLNIEIFSLKTSYAICEVATHALALRLQHIVEEKSIDIVHAHTYHPVIICAKLKSVCLVSTLHNRANEDFINVYGKCFGTYMLKRYYKALNKYNANVAVAQSAACMYKKYIPNVTNVNNGIDVQRFSLIDKSNKNKLRQILKLPLNKKIIITSGRIEAEKGIEELIGWFIDNYYNLDNYILLMIGNGSKLNKCRMQAKNFNRIILKGRVDNVEQYLQCADFYISNSKSEGMSMAVCEAISCGLYPILSDIPAHRDAAQAIGAMFFNSLNNISIHILIQPKADRNLLHSYLVENFSMQSMAKGYLDVYKQVINKTLNHTNA